MRNYLNEIFERGSKFILSPEIVARMDEGTRKAIDANQKEVVLGEYYVRKKITATAGGIFNVLKEVDDKAPGINNMDKGYIKNGTYFALLAIGVAYGREAGGSTNNKPAFVRYSNSEYIDTLPTPLINSEFTISKGKKELMPTMRTANFFANAYAEYGVNSNEENMLVLTSPKLIEPKKKMGFAFEFPEVAPAFVGTDGHYVEIRMVGVSLEDRND